jgi:TolB protein
MRARAGAWEIYSMVADGSNPVDLTSSKVDEYWPTWSSDGREIAYIRHFALYTMDADGSEQQKVIDANCIRCRAPAWSPDGTRIAFQQQVDGNMDIYVVNTDGTGLTRVTLDPAVDVQPAWSPDGRLLAFKSRRHRHGDIFAIHPDGTGIAPVTTSRGNDFGPDWSPDGSRIAFASRRVGATDLYVVNADGTDARRLTNTLNADEDFPAWSPDGHWIAFDNGRRHEAISLMRADGSDRHSVITGKGDPAGPDWQAIG